MIKSENSVGSQCIDYHVSVSKVYMPLGMFFAVILSGILWRQVILLKARQTRLIFDLQTLNEAWLPWGQQPEILLGRQVPEEQAG